MNKNVALFFLGTHVQDFIGSAYNFGFMLLFYSLTDSLLYAGWLTAATLVVSRVLLFFIIPWCKRYSPIYMSSWMSIAMGVSSVAAAATYPFWSEQLVWYFVLSTIFSTIMSVDQSFTSAVLPRLVEKDYLYKANSLNGIFLNIALFTAPFVGFVFFEISLSILLLIYGAVCLGSAVLLFLLFAKAGEPRLQAQIPPAEKKLRYFSDEWLRTIRLILSNAAILHCVMIGLVVNFVFAGISGPYLLGVGQSDLGSTLLKVSVALGSFCGVYGVYLLKVKDHYELYLKRSMVGILAALLFLAQFENLYANLIGIAVLTLFVMFIMNSTGTFLQLSTPKEELPSVYAFRASLYAVVVPLSYIVMGWVMENWGANRYFYLSLAEVLLVVLFLYFSPRKTSAPEQNAGAQ